MIVDPIPQVRWMVIGLKIGLEDNNATWIEFNVRGTFGGLCSGARVRPPVVDASWRANEDDRVISSKRVVPKVSGW